MSMYTKICSFLFALYVHKLPCEQRDTVVSGHPAQHADAGQLI